MQFFQTGVFGLYAETVEHSPVHVQADIACFTVYAVLLFRSAVHQLVAVVVDRSAETAAHIYGRQITGVSRGGVIVADLLLVTNDTDGVVLL